MLTNIIKQNFERDDENKLDQYNANIVESPSNNIWYNLSIINPVVLNPPNPAISFSKIAKLSFTRDSTILSNPSNYRVAVTRLSCPSYVPLFLFPKDDGYFTITLSYVPTNPLQPTIQITKNIDYVNSSIGDPYNEYRPVYYIQTLLNFINQKYEEAYDEIVIAVNAIGEVYTPVSAPYIVYDPKTEILSMIASYPYTLIDKYGIFMNMPLFDGFFTGFYARLISGGVGNFNAYQIIIQDLGNNKKVIGGNDYIDMLEEFNSGKLFNKVDRLTLISNMIPLNSNLVGTSQSLVNNVLLDWITPDVSSDRRKLDYQPYINKWHELTQTHPMRSIDMELQIIYDDGSVVPFFIPGGSRCDITLLFIPKGCIYQ